MSSTINVERICEYCGKKFIAHTFTTRYCDKICNSRAYKANAKAGKYNAVSSEVKEIETKKLVQTIDEIQVIQTKEYINIQETAVLLGISRRSVYNIIKGENIPVIHMGRRTIIARTDITNLLACHMSTQDNAVSKYSSSNAKEKSITEFYSVKEITEKYHIKYNRIYVITTEYNIPYTEIEGRKYYSKRHIDDYFKKKGYKEAEAITEWYILEEIKETYNMTIGAVHNFTSRHRIPKQKINGKTYYSKAHVDQTKQPKITEDDYVTVPEACEKFQITRDILYSRCTVYNIRKKRKGKIILVCLADLEKLYNSK